jgi:hypothetical protein
MSGQKFRRLFELLQPAFPGLLPVTGCKISSLTVARQRGIFTRFPVFAERQRRAYRRNEKDLKNVERAI